MDQIWLQHKIKHIKPGLQLQILISFILDPCNPKVIPQPEVTLLDSALLKISGHKKFDLYTNPKKKNIREKETLFLFLFFLLYPEADSDRAVATLFPQPQNLPTSYEGRITSDAVGTVKKRREGDFAFGLC